MWAPRLILRFLFALVSPFLALLVAATLALVDLLSRVQLFFLPKLQPPPALTSTGVPRLASIVIPNWNGRDLLENYLPGVVEAVFSNDSRHQILVVDNASTDDGIAFLHKRFPQVDVLALDHNLGFGGGSNAGVRHARHDLVVLLNNDMRVTPDFLAPLLAPFDDPLVFAVSSQIFLSDPAKDRAETGLTEGWWAGTGIRVAHRIDPDVRSVFPCYYAGGGSSAYDRRKFLALGGFDPLYHPFYFEDTDLGHMAWKRGWKVLYQPASVVYHEHRGTIGRTFSSATIRTAVRKNAILYCWKHIHAWPWLAQHLASLPLAALRSLRRPDPESVWQPTTASLLAALRQLPEACRARWRAHTLAVLDDKEALRRHQGGYFRDRFQAPREPPGDRLQVLFAAPYAIEPTRHGGAVFMANALGELARHADVHLVGFLDREDERPAQHPLAHWCRSLSFVVRPHARPRAFSRFQPRAAIEFANRDFAWTLHRTIYQQRIDVVQLEYTMLGQYAAHFQSVPCFLFEHDIAFQSLSRRLAHQPARRVWRESFFEYLRLMRWELRMLPTLTRVQLCSEENRQFLAQYLPQMYDRMDIDLRAGVPVSRYTPVFAGREPDTLLFVGNFSHAPNLEALRWFAARVLPLITAARPHARLIVVGAHPPDPTSLLPLHSSIELGGAVEDVQLPLRRYAVFVCPIFTGSGIRVKLIEAFASGIPVVSTSLGAEGLANASHQVCELADSPAAFAAACLRLLDDPIHAEQLARRARQLVEQTRDIQPMVRRLVSIYRREVARRRPAAIESLAVHG